MPTAQDFVAIAQRHIGERYRLGAFAPKDNAQWSGPWDCAEFASWLVFQLGGVLVGCTNNQANPALADAYSGAWARDAAASERSITLGQAKATAGAVLVRKPPAGGIGHVAISRGDGSTVEAHSEARGVTNDTVDGRRWDLAMLAPGIDYPGLPAPMIVAPPGGLVLRLTHPPMRGSLVKKLQSALKARGFAPGARDGVYGPHTEAAVRAFQLEQGLVPDGEAGPVTQGLLLG